MNKLEEALQFLLNVINNGSLAAIQNEAMLAGRVLEEYRAALTCPSAPKAEPAAIISVNALSRMFVGTDGVDPASPGTAWRKGWNAALRQAMDYALAAATQPTEKT